jgi:trans-aconitate methyltransferase
MNKDWQAHLEYYEQTKNRPPSKLLVKAMSFVADRQNALDLGSGALKDSKYLLDQGFKEVWAVDKEALPVELSEYIKDERFHFVQSTFESFEFPNGKFDLINASYSLPFISPSEFSKTWSHIISALKSGGVFAGQFFGVNDEWNDGKNGMTFHSEEEIQEVLKGLEVVELSEEEQDRKMADGDGKHWHVFNVIARKV